METKIQINIFNAIRTLSNSLSYEYKKQLIDILNTEILTKEISYKQEIIDAKNSNEGFVFNEQEFELINKKMLNNEKIDFDKYRIEN